MLKDPAYNKGNVEQRNLIQNIALLSKLKPEEKASLSNNDKLIKKAANAISEYFLAQLMIEKLIHLLSEIHHRTLEEILFFFNTNYKGRTNAISFCKTVKNRCQQQRIYT